jgi:quercetin dioxygenase-like cupin family protein
VKIIDPAAVAASAVAANVSRPATAVAHDDPDTRLVAFRIEPGQEVRPHTSTSSVLLSVVSGSGMVSGAEGEQRVRAGDVVLYARGELHGMRAVGEQLVILAVITPRPA